MISTSLSIWSGALTVLLLGAAVTTDLSSRRIPNAFTFPAIAAAILVRMIAQDWPGVALALGGALLAPILLLVLHAGKGLGMGDLKLSAAVGALLGPALAITAMLASTIAGGILAVIVMMTPGGPLAHIASTFLIGLPFFKTPSQENFSKTGHAPDTTAAAVPTMPYGVAIAAGTLAALAVCWSTGNEKWFFMLMDLNLNTFPNISVD